MAIYIKQLGFRDETTDRATMARYFKEATDDFFKALISLYKSRRIILNSGLFGNILALALELHEWKRAEQIIISNKIDLNCIAWDMEGKNIKSAVEFLNELMETVNDEDKEKIKTLINIIGSSRKLETKE